LVVSATDGTAIVRFSSSQALIIGNSRYSAGWAPLAGVAEDVTQIRKALESQGFSVAVSMDLTRTQMDECISTFVAEKGQDPNGRIVFYYAGHGQTLKNNQGQENGYLVPVDAPVPTDTTRPAFIAKAYPIQRIKIASQELGCRHALAVFDACFSGSLFSPLRGGNAAILQQAAEPVRMFITSGSADEQVPDVSIFREEFVAALTEGVADANKDGWTTGSELSLYIRQQVMGRRAAAGGRQTPQCGISEQSGLNRGDVVFTSPATHMVTAATIVPAIVPAAPLPPPARAQIVSAGSGPVWAANTGSDATGPWADLVVGNVTQRLRLIPAGGGVDPLWVADSECTQRLWQAVKSNNPSSWTGQTRLKELLTGIGEPQALLLPVESVSWDDTQGFLTALNAKVPGLSARLPNEVEWAWAATLGQGVPADLDPIAWTRSSGIRNPQEIRKLQANPSGLHDMLGNVWEWCADSWVGQPVDDPAIERLLRLGRTQEQLAGTGRRPLRGGGFLDKANAVSPDQRTGEKPDYRSRDIGFRFVVNP